MNEVPEKKETIRQLDAQFLLDFVSRDLGAFKRYVSGFVNIMLVSVWVLIAVEIFRIYTNERVLDTCVVYRAPE